LSENLPDGGYSDQHEGKSLTISEEMSRGIPAEEPLQPKLQASG
jgi:hypothetical protein